MDLKEPKMRNFAYGMARSENWVPKVQIIPIILY
jgi:hypothetical protein